MWEFQLLQVFVVGLENKKESDNDGQTHIVTWKREEIPKQFLY